MTRRTLAGLLLAAVVLQAGTAAATGRLLQLVDETLQQRLDAPIDSVVSPDGAFLYVADTYYYYGHSITVFARDTGTGELSLVDVVQSGVGGSGTLRLASLALSPDGAHLYATGDDTVTVFARNAGTGRLTWVETQRNGVGGVTGLTTAVKIAVSPDGAHAYVTSRYSNALLTFARNATTGALSYVETKVDGAPDGLYGAGGLAISSDGAYVYVAGYNDGAVLTFSRDAGTGLLTLVESESMYGPLTIALSPDGAHAYVISSYDRLSVYGRDAGTGALTFLEVQVDGIGGITSMSGATEVVVTPDGAHVYVAAQSDNAIVVFARDAGTGSLTLVEEQKNGVGGVTGLNGANSVTVTPDGADLYVTASGYYYYGTPALTGFSRNAATGGLTQFAYERSGYGPVAMAASPDGAHVYGVGSGTITLWSRDAGTGSLTPHASEVVDDFAGVDGIAGANDIVISPDGAHVYVTGPNDYALAAFSRDATSGALTFVEAEFDGVGGVDGLNGTSDLAMSADGAHLYVAALYDNSVAVFTRDAGTGQITETQLVRQGVGGVVGLSYPYSLALSPDGAHLYVTGSDYSAGAGSLSTFSRDAATGALTQIATLSFADGYPSDVTVSPDGAFVYLFDNSSKDILRVYARNPGTGALSLSSTIKANEGGLSFNNYYSAHFLFTADGATAYFKGGILSRNPANGALAFVAPQNDGPGSLSGGIVVGPNDEVYASANGTGVRHFTQGFAGCQGGPVAPCRPTSGGIVRLAAATPSFNWTWKSATTVLPADFGDPVLTDHYALCLWDESGVTPALIMRALAPAGQRCSATRACWKTTATGFTYSDRARTPEGLGGVTLKAGAGEGARVRIVAGKTNLGPPPFPLPLPIRVQVQSSSGACFEATYSTAGSNSTQGFLAKPD
jgi:6-phosphogluconolactonase (cycloisomerase 2 family)